ncbi:RNA polymerase sigma factor [Noviherbaspirillum saxi]|uniref:RNA polymerase sigma factor n=1 Tax=Noviherbaspirillum saxi TaxID=2320863 RepID=A0A3A3FG33_9BURK|nr:RNA polymerase sigma factor [Noviherbaspirillum saxi]RJF92047.1 RNA polymerase sigma factor [Noviherbaspirillum saxi]
MQISSSLFEAAQAGDPDALNQLLLQLKPDIRRYARRQCHRSSVIEDVVQEALIVIYRRVGSVRTPAALAGWLITMITRLCMLPALMLMRGAEELTAVDETRYLASVPNDDLRLDLVRAIESLPAPYREIIILRDLEELTIHEASRRIGITREAAKSRLHRARAFLREYLIDGGVAK